MQRLGHADAYRRTSSTVWEMGLFGLAIAGVWAGPVAATYALVVEGTLRGWMSVSARQYHFIVAYLISQHGSPEPLRLLPKMATGGCVVRSRCPSWRGVDLRHRTGADRSGDAFVLNG
jgi:hypothetical protein